MLRFEGQKDFPSRGPADLWERLSDARFLVECVPDVHEVRSQQKEQAVFILRPGFAFVRGTVEATMRVVEATSPSTVRLSLVSKGIGTSSEVEAVLNIVPAEAGSRVEWSVEVKSLGGLLKAVPHGLIRGAAQRVIGDAWSRIEARLAAEAA